ncbi:response regulator [Hymenobacter arizonensis]|uniref:Response regulator receiver domain-containing protein n=1 Tax=Hymenobacter arizonensis TaxID=1227077 RepID=A0A1I5XI07_HYMAR|nr:response regulator [Hymenobacter arizonensis]SFQ31598.1 Response regulator receiver domain-containing protein [Hymenobacter arizonensis]
MAAISCTLLVDDDDTTNFLNQALLRRMAVTDTVLVAGNGQQALDLLQTHCDPVATPSCPALILLDMKMPLMNGFEFLQAYTQRPPTNNPAVVIIMLTTSLNPRDLEQMQGLPIAGYLTKPLTRDKINQILHQHFDQPARDSEPPR